MFTLCHLVLHSRAKNACSYLDQNNMMSQTSDPIWSWHIPLLPSSRTRTPPGFNYWTSVAPAFQSWSCYWVIILFHPSVESWFTCCCFDSVMSRSLSCEPNNLINICLWLTAESRATVAAAWNRFKPPPPPWPVIYYWLFQSGASVVVYSNCISLSASC